MSGEAVHTRAELSSTSSLKEKPLSDVKFLAALRIALLGVA